MEDEVRRRAGDGKKLLAVVNKIGECNPDEGGC